MSFDLTTLPKDIEDIIENNVVELYRNDFSKVLEELKGKFIIYDKTEMTRRINNFHQRMQNIHTLTSDELLQMVRDSVIIEDPYATIRHKYYKKETLEENRKRWEVALKRHREYFDFGNRNENQEEMSYWSQFLVVKYAHPELTRDDYSFRREEAFGCF